MNKNIYKNTQSIYADKRYLAKLKLVVNNLKKNRTVINSYKANSSKTKRFFDFVISLIFLVLFFSWLYLIIAVLIKLNSKGPVLFKQNRIGLNGVLFLCYKFRTMHTDKIIPRYTPTTPDDPRITSVGKFLRKSNLDELPQLINVLLGNMTIVGPRPHAVAFHERYSKFIPNIDKRLMVKPGITGLAQIRGFRGDVLDEQENKIKTLKRITYDIIYIRKWSIALDIYILIVTAKQMLFRRTNGH